MGHGERQCAYSMVNSPPCREVSLGSSGGFRVGEDSYRQHPQQRRLSCILESYHGNVHLGGPAGVSQGLPMIMSGHAATQTRLWSTVGW